MSAYINLTLDTIGPSGVTVKINGDETKATSTAAQLTISCADTDLTGYQMKIWGTASAPTESEAVWETYQPTKNITLTDGDGVKTVYVKLRDDVWNESATASDTISIYLKLPSIIDITVDRAKISLVEGKDNCAVVFGYDEDISEIKVMLVEDINAAHNNVTNVSIPTTHGSGIDACGALVTKGKSHLEAVKNIEANNDTCAVIYGADIAAVSPGDGVKIVKVFVKSALSGNWSI